MAAEQAKLPRLLQEEEDEEQPIDTGVQSFEIDPERVMVREGGEEKIELLT